MRIACWVTKVTDTQSEYVILLFHGNCDARTHLKVTFLSTLPALLVANINCVLLSWWQYVWPFSVLVYEAENTFRQHLVHSRNLVTAIGGGQKSTTGVRNCNLRSYQVIKRRKIGLNQSLISIYSFPPLWTRYFPFF